MTLMSNAEVMEITTRVGQSLQGGITKEKGTALVITADEGARIMQDRMLLIAALRTVALSIPEQDRQYLSQGTRQLLGELRIYA